MRDDNVFIKKLYASVCLSAMLALIGRRLGQIISVMIAGQYLDPAALSVMGVVSPVYTIFTAMGALLGVGGAVSCARAIGEGRIEKCHQTFTVTYLLNLVIAVILTSILLLFIDPLVRFLGAAPEIFEETKRYAFINIVGGFFIMSIYPAYDMLRLDGRYGASMVIFFTMTALTIFLNIVLLSVFRMDVEAAILAIVAGSAVAGIGGAVLLFTRSKNLHLTSSVFKKAYHGELRQIARNIIVTGSPNAVASICTVGYTIVLNRLIAGSFGILALSSFKLTDTIFVFAMIFFNAITGPLTQFVAVFGAEKDSKSIRQLLAQVFKTGGLFILCFVGVCEFLTPQIAGLFGMASPDTLPTAVPAVRMFAACLLPALINIIIVCIHQAGNRSFLANILTVSRLFIWIVIAAPLLSARIGITGVWHSFWAAEMLTLLSAVILSLVYRRGNKYLSPVLLIDREAEFKGVYKSFSVKNSVESITESSAGIMEFCEQNNLGAKLSMAISLSIEEMLVVIRDHSLRGKEEATMNVRVLIEENTVIMRIRNAGPVFNPVDYVCSNGAPEDETMGIKIILGLAKAVDHRNTFGINNTMILLNR
jgi:Na+-driven multidrug efflux pump/anti-sigma regulatory factor (Ser/Thr protein kinase)